MVREGKELPQDSAYFYNPRGDSAKNPPISIHMFDILFNATCDSPCNWWNFHDCMLLRDSNDTLSRIPKRTKPFKDDYETLSIWGLEAMFAVSFAYVFIYHCTIIAGPFAFFFWWLRTHPDDYQNAAVPVTIVLGGLSLFWSGGGILTSRSYD